MFHASTLKKYVPNGSHRLQHEKLDILLELSYQEEVVQILDQSMKTLYRKEVPLLKVLWSWQGIEEATWKCKDEMQRHISRLFPVEDDDTRY